MDVNATIQMGDVLTLRRLLREEPSRANELIRWGIRNPCLTHPLHYISDMLFKGILPKGSEVALAEALIEAGADLNFQSKREDGKKGDTPLIGAASLGAEDLGIRLLDAGARPELRGLFGETALHWAAMLGEDRLAARLIERSDMALLNLKDEKYESPPVGWAIHGWSNPPAGNHGRQQRVVELLVAAGVMVEPSLMESDDVRSNGAISAALRREND
jgi:Ankyrin repeats (3 copies)